MTDYAEEQRNELEALESIYPEEIEVLQTQPCASFSIRLTSQYEDPEVEPASCTLQFTYVATYPDSAPLVEIPDSENLEDAQLRELLELTSREAEENLGMVMVFTLVSAVQERLSDMVEEGKKRQEEEAERKKKILEEEEHKKFEGTRVTIENFLAWKTKFDAEMAELKKRTKDSETNKNRLSGKELFMRDATLYESDVQFLQSEEDIVAVDESLFQDMDDLDLGDEELLDDLED